MYDELKAAHLQKLKISLQNEIGRHINANLSLSKLNSM